jgi:hypothetical protein
MSWTIETIKEEIAKVELPESIYFITPHAYYRDSLNVKAPILEKKYSSEDPIKRMLNDSLFLKINNDGIVYIPVYDCVRTFLEEIRHFIRAYYCKIVGNRYKKTATYQKMSDLFSRTSFYSSELYGNRLIALASYLKGCESSPLAIANVQALGVISKFFDNNYADFKSEVLK